MTMNLLHSVKPMLRWALAALILGGVATQARANSDEVILERPLAGTGAEPGAVGSARYRVRPDQIQLEIEVENLTATATVQFLVDGTLIGASPVIEGQANLELESETAQVPVITDATKILVRNADTGATVASSDPSVAEGEGEGEDQVGHEGEGEGEGQSSDPGEVEVELLLKGTTLDPAATGTAELKNDNERRRIEVEVQGVSAASRVSVLVDGINVGTGPVREGEASVKRDERANYTIPVVTAASRVDVINSDSGDILLSNQDVVVNPGEGEGEGEGEGQPASGDLTLQLKLGTNGTYVPGEHVIIEAILSYTGDIPVTALSVEQILPAGWSFVQGLDELGAFITPVAADEGTLTWAWIAVPAFPATLRYEVAVPATATGVQSLTGNVVYRRAAGAEYAVATLSAPTAQGFATTFCHSTDTNKDWNFELSEVLRMIQFYNSASFHCEDGTEDGFAPGPGSDSCLGHDGDRLHPDWQIDLSEVLRTVQIYNSEDHAYTIDDTTEDGFHPGRYDND